MADYSDHVWLYHNGFVKQMYFVWLKMRMHWKKLILNHLVTEGWQYKLVLETLTLACRILRRNSINNNYTRVLSTWTSLYRKVILGIESIKSRANRNKLLLLIDFQTLLTRSVDFIISKLFTLHGLYAALKLAIIEVINRQNVVLLNDDCT